jgi:hypothetical protein
MRKSIKRGISYLAGGLALSTIVGLGIPDYFSKPSIDNVYEFKLLYGTSKYLQEYNGPNAEEALKYAGFTLDAVLESKNPKIPTSEVVDLKKEVEVIDKRIESSQTPSAYQSDLKSLGNEIEKFVYRNARGDSLTDVGMSISYLVTGIFGLIFLGISGSNFRKAVKDD